MEGTQTGEEVALMVDDEGGKSLRLGDMREFIAIIHTSNSSGSQTHDELNAN